MNTQFDEMVEFARRGGRMRFREDDLGYLLVDLVADDGDKKFAKVLAIPPDCDNPWPAIVMGVAYLCNHIDKAKQADTPALVGAAS